MSITWFMIKCLIVTFVIISFMQLKTGNDKTLEIHFKDWMTKLSASKRIQGIAEGGHQISNQVVKEFTTEDGKTVYITSPRTPSNTISNSYIEMNNTGDENQIIIKDNSFIGRVVSGLKDQALNSNSVLDDKLKQKVQEEMIKDIEQRMKKSGIESQTLEAENNQKGN